MGLSYRPSGVESRAGPVTPAAPPRRAAV